MSELPDLLELATDEGALDALIKQNGYPWAVGYLQAGLRRIVEAVGKDSLECAMRRPVTPNVGGER